MIFIELGKQTAHEAAEADSLVAVLLVYSEECFDRTISCAGTPFWTSSTERDHRNPRQE
jgi:hypothetical protein